MKLYKEIKDEKLKLYKSVKDKKLKLYKDVKDDKLKLLTPLKDEKLKLYKKYKASLYGGSSPKRSMLQYDDAMMADDDTADVDDALSTEVAPPG